MDTDNSQHPKGSEDNFFDKNLDPESRKESFNPDSLKLLIKFIDFLKVKGEAEIWTLFLMQERLIYTAAYLMEKGTRARERERLNEFKRYETL